MYCLCTNWCWSKSCFKIPQNIKLAVDYLLTIIIIESFHCQFCSNFFGYKLIGINSLRHNLVLNYLIWKLFITKIIFSECFLLRGSNRLINAGNTNLLRNAIIPNTYQERKEDDSTLYWMVMLAMFQ